MHDLNQQADSCRPPRFFYGWYIVAVRILVNIAGTFAFSSTLSIFLKPITEELGVTRGAFSLIRTFEIGVAALIVPLLGPWIDRHGGRGVLVLGVLMEGAGLLLSSLVQSFWQFVLVRCSLVIAGEALLGSLVINVTIAQWFVRKRGRAMGIANLGTGIAKLSIPLAAASLFGPTGIDVEFDVIAVPIASKGYITSQTFITPNLGTPSAGVFTNCTGLPVSTGISGLGSGVAAFLVTPSSANLATVLTDETGTGSAVFSNSPTLVTPALGTPSALVGTNLTGTTSGLTVGTATSISGIGDSTALDARYGYSQTVQNMTGSRALATPYTNSTSAPIKITVWSNVVIAGIPTATLTIAGSP